MREDEMAYLLAYTKKGEGCYPDFNYPGHVGYNCDWEHAMHFALSEDGKYFMPLRNNTGILFAKASFEENEFVGVTKTLIEPWLCRGANHTFHVLAVRRNQNVPDSTHLGCMMVFDSADLIHYSEPAFVKLSEEEICKPRCTYEKESGIYYVEWETASGRFYAQTKDLEKIETCDACAKTQFDEVEKQMAEGNSFGIDGCVPGNVIAITAEEAQVLNNYFGDIHYVKTNPVYKSWPLGKSLASFSDGAPKATCVYSDGSTHEKKVAWDKDALEKVDVSKPGTWKIPGKVLQKCWKFPMPLHFREDELVEFYGMSDPCVTEYHEKYYLSSSGTHNIQLRIADTIEGTFDAEPTVVYRIPLENGLHFVGTWAAELHEIDGVLYMFTSLCENAQWIHVKSYILRCNGDPADPNAWEAPQKCVKIDGSDLTEGGISLDMSYFRDHGKDYVMWSDRKIHYGVDDEHFEAGTADIYIATVDPQKPWQLTSEPHCVVRPMYGWDRYETEVDEGPYLLRRGDDLFVTISGSSTSMGDLYDVGLLHAKSGADLLKQESWTWLGYPLLTKESVPGEYGPGHNNFVKDPDTGDELMIYHAIPHDENDKTLQRQPGIRRVHWAKTGLPYLEMTPERDLPEGCDDVVMELTIE
jgi:GH43 family beta-xylosidase